MARSVVVSSLSLLLRRIFSLDVRSLAAFRMAMGVIVASDALLRSRDASLMLAPDGIFPLPLLRDYLADPCAWSLATLVDSPWMGPLMLCVEAAAGTLLAVGCATRFATVVSWVAVVSIVRRTAPATNAGDEWLTCLLFWSMFLPLASCWSWDARRGSRSGRVFSAATVALVLQIAVVYLAAGLAKWNDSWLSGAAFRFAVSVHDHGTPLGEWLLGQDWLARPFSWGVLSLELLGPILLIVWPAPRIRVSLVMLFMLFHLATCVTMTVGLFGFIGMAAWLALVPTEAWDRLMARGAGDRLAPSDACGRLSWAGTWTCAVAGMLALVSLVHTITPWQRRPLPWPLRSLISIPCLHQEWDMFGEVRPQEQWVYAGAELADGSVVDLLRGGRPLELERPAGGFSSLPHHRWHKLFWGLPKPRQRIFAPAIAGALARHWNAGHPPDRHVRILEIRFARLGRTAADDTLHELLLATWPPRHVDGRGGLDRLLGGPPQASSHVLQSHADRR
jgi:hypothetical protein